MLRTLFTLVLTAAAVRAEDVVVHGNVLFPIQTARAGVTAAARAADVSRAIERAAQDSRVNSSELTIAETAEESAVLANRAFLFAVTNDDARAAGLPRDELARRYRDRAALAISEYRNAWTLSELGPKLGFLLLDLFLLGLFVWFTQWAARRLSNWLGNRCRDWFARFRPLSRSILLPAFLVLRTFVAILILAAVVAAAAYGLSLFSSTRPLANSLLDLLRGTSSQVAGAILGYLPDLATVFAIVFLGWQAIRLLRGLADAVAEGTIRWQGFAPEWAEPTFDLAAFLLVVLAIVMAFPYLPGGDSPALRGASIFIGVLVSLGSGSTVGSAISGVIITYMRPFQVGDRVKIGDSEGDVIEKSILVTRIRTVKNVEVIVPNSTVLGTQILNYSSLARRDGLILHTTITIGYGTPWPKVHALMIAAARATPGIVEAPAPFVLQTALNDFHISYQINAYTREPNRMQDIQGALHENIQTQFAASGVEILSPAYLAMRDGNPSTIPVS
ncbi:MAG: mechanosensitive ion channel family protein [Acidobacteria bacterium]|nr:mechanosensitive ion channel family protein [Acidobacteriota bacterium]